MATGVNALVVKVAELCNLRCGYCYMYEHADQSYLKRPKEMSDTVFAQLIQRTIEYCDGPPERKMELCFHGGEPTLIGHDRMNQLASRAVDTLDYRLAGLTMQTNATLIDEEWISVLSRHGFQVGVSIDGVPELQDRTRPFHNGNGSHEATERGLDLLMQAGLLSSVLCVIDPYSDGLANYHYIRSLGVSAIDFLLPDVTHDERYRRYPDVGPTPIAEYLIPIFEDWFKEDNPDIRIRTFWSLIRLMMGGKPETDSFGNPGMSYMVVESDGSLHALDALRVCEEGIADSGLSVATHGFSDFEHAVPIVRDLITGTVPLSDTCNACAEVTVCGGGYLPHRYSKARGFQNPSVWCEDIQLLLATIRERAGSQLDA